MAWYKTATPVGGGGSVELVTWQDGTDEQIAAMINAYYEGKLTLDQIKDVWTEGDVRNVDISAINTTGTYNNNTWSVGESHRAQTIQMEILDFDHDTLTTPIGSITKALITVDMKGCLRDATVTDTTGSSNAERGYMNSTNDNTTGWTNCARRKWCNGGFYQALPEYFRTLVKPVNKLTSAGDQSSTINTDSDYVFLLSEIEIFGTTTYSYSGEGTQYSWYGKNSTNRYKMPGWSSSYPLSGYWWERSPYSSYSDTFCDVNRGGSASSGSASSTFGLVPACAL